MAGKSEGRTERARDKSDRTTYNKTPDGGVVNGARAEEIENELKKTECNIGEVKEIVR